MKEAEFSRIMRKSLDKAGCKTFALVAGELQEPGYPDCHVASKRWHGWIEWKVDTALRPLQARQMRDLIRHGDNAFVLRLVGDEVFIQTHEGIGVGRFAFGPESWDLGKRCLDAICKVK